MMYKVDTSDGVDPLFALLSPSSADSVPFACNAQLVGLMQFTIRNTQKKLSNKIGGGETSSPVRDFRSNQMGKKKKKNKQKNSNQVLKPLGVDRSCKKTKKPKR